MPRPYANEVGLEVESSSRPMTDAFWAICSQPCRRLIQSFRDQQHLEVVPDTTPNSGVIDPPTAFLATAYGQSEVVIREHKDSYVNGV